MLSPTTLPWLSLWEVTSLKHLPKIISDKYSGRSKTHKDNIPIAAVVQWRVRFDYSLGAQCTTYNSYCSYIQVTTRMDHKQGYHRRNHDESAKMWFSKVIPRISWLNQYHLSVHNMTTRLPMAADWLKPGFFNICVPFPSWNRTHRNVWSLVENAGGIEAPGNCRTEVIRRLREVLVAKDKTNHVICRKW